MQNKTAASALLLSLALLFGCANVVVDENATQPSVVWEPPKASAPGLPPAPPLPAALENRSGAGTYPSELQAMVLAMMLARANQGNPSGNLSEQDLQSFLLLLNSTNASGMGNLSAKTNASYFYSPSCPYCGKIAPLIEAMQSQFSNSTSWNSHNVLTPEGYEAFDQMAKRLNLSNSNRVVPIVVAGNQALIGEPEINSSLERLLANMSNRS